MTTPIITDADREAVTRFVERAHKAPESPFDLLDEAFARHREAETARIVAWLRQQEVSRFAPPAKRYRPGERITISDVERPMHMPQL